MAESNPILDKLRQDPGFDKLPTPMREELITREMELATTPAPAPAPDWRQYAPVAPIESVAAANRGKPWWQPAAALGQNILGDVSGATVGARLGGAIGGPPGALIGGALGSIGGNFVARRANVERGWEEPGLLGDVLSLAVPAATKLPGAVQGLAKSSEIGQGAVREATRADYESYLSRRQSDITQVEDANTAIRQAHEAAQAARQADIDRLTALNTAAKEQHGTLQQAIKDKNAAGWKVRQDAIDARQAEIDRIKADNLQTQASYEAARKVALEERTAQEQINADAKLRHDAVSKAQQANYARLKETNTRFADRIRRQTEKLDLKARAAQAANPAKARTMMEGMPDIPTKEGVEKLYDELDTVLKEHNISLEVPEYRAAQAEIKTWGEGVKKMPRGEEFDAMIKVYTRGLDTKEPLTLREMSNGTSFVGNQVRMLRKRAATGAGESLLVTDELAAAVKLHIALDESLLKAAQKFPEASEMRTRLLDAREAYKRRATYEDLTDFWDEIITLNPRDGTEVINPIAGLKKLDTPAYASTKRFMQQTPVDPKKPDGPTMYDKTVETLQKMIPEQMTVQDRVQWYARLHVVGDPEGKLYDINPLPSREIVAPPIAQRPPLPEAYMTQVPPAGGAPQQVVPEPFKQLGRGDYLPEPKPPVLQPVPERLPPLNEALLARVPDRPPSWTAQVAGMPPIRQGPVAAAAQYAPAAAFGGAAMLLDKYIPGGMTTAAGVGVATGMGVRNVLAAVMMKPGSQDLLVKLIESRGLRLDPVMTGILNAAVREGISYGLPQDAPATR